MKFYEKLEFFDFGNDEKLEFGDFGR